MANWWKKWCPGSLCGFFRVDCHSLNSIVRPTCAIFDPSVRIRSTSPSLPGSLPMKPGKSDTIDKTGKVDTNWSSLRRNLVSATIVLHALAILSGVWASYPSSELERSLADVFSPYNQMIDQGYSYRYFAPEPPPTPILEAKLIAADGRELETVRVPERGVSPRLRYQRQLAVAREFAVSVEQSRNDSHGAGHVHPPFWAASYARHLGRRNPACVRVKLFLVLHLIPSRDEVQRSLFDRKRPPDLDSPSYYSIPELIGEFPCDPSAS